MSHASLQRLVTRLDNAVHHGGPFGVQPDLIILHINEGDTFASSIEYLNTTEDKQASYHYGIERDGAIGRMCDPALIAYHAGDSAWPNPVRATPANPDHPNAGSVNHRAIGICWANSGNGEQLLTSAQLESAHWLCALFMGLHGIPLERVRGHYEIAPGRKRDPLPAIDMDTYRALLTTYLRTS